MVTHLSWVKSSIDDRRPLHRMPESFTRVTPLRSLVCLCRACGESPLPASHSERLLGFTTEDFADQVTYASLARVEDKMNCLPCALNLEVQRLPRCSSARS